MGGKQKPTGVGLVTVPNPKGPILITDVLLSVTGYCLLPRSSFASPSMTRCSKIKYYKSRHLPSTPTLSLNPTLSFSFSFFNHFTVTMENGGFHGYRKLPNTTNSAGKPLKYLSG